MIKIAEHKNFFCLCMPVLDSGFPTPWFSDSRYYISHSLSVELGFRIPTISGIQDSLSCIPDFKDQDSGTHNKKIAPNSECEFPKTGQFLLLVKFQLLPVSTGACEFMPFYFDFFYAYFPSRQMPANFKGKKPHPSKHLGSDGALPSYLKLSRPFWKLASHSIWWWHKIKIWTRMYLIHEFGIYF